MKKEMKPLWTYEDLDTPRDFLKIAVEGNAKLADIDSNAMKLIATRVIHQVVDFFCILTSFHFFTFFLWVFQNNALDSQFCKSICIY